LCSLLLLLPVLALQAQQLTTSELSIGVAGAAARHTFSGVELGVGERPSSDMRLAFAAAGGVEAGRTAARAQATVQMLVNSLSRTGVGVYGGVGAAFAARERTPGRGYLALVLGVEGRPGRRRGWYAETGFAGGVRVAVGWRLRSFPVWWR
jgi:hypothetical protein